MPSDSNGNYSLPNGYLATAGTTILPSEHNPPLEDVATSLTARLMRSGAGGMTGPLKLADGTVAAPAESFTTDPTTGFYKTTNGIGVAVGGVKVVEFTSGGIASGFRYIGELFGFTSATAPPLCVFPVGQTLLRASYPDLWTFAQSEIAASNTFYNNGDGSTTFGIGDLRGRLFGAVDNLGGTTANRLVNGSMAAVRHTIGGAGGADTNTLDTTKIPSHSHTATDSGHTHGLDTNALTHSGPPLINIVGSGSFGIGNTGASTTSGTANISVSSTGGGAAHDNLQPMILGAYALFAGA